WCCGREDGGDCPAIDKPPCFVVCCDGGGSSVGDYCAACLGGLDWDLAPRADLIRVDADAVTWFEVDEIPRNLYRQDSKPDEVVAVDALIAGGEHGADSQ